MLKSRTDVGAECRCEKGRLGICPGTSESAREPHFCGDTRFGQAYPDGKEMNAPHFRLVPCFPGFFYVSVARHRRVQSYKSIRVQKRTSGFLCD